MSLPIIVETYSTFGVDEYPFRFHVDHGSFDISLIEARWEDGRSEYFKVRTTTGKRFFLRCDLQEHKWTYEVLPVEKSGLVWVTVNARQSFALNDPVIDPQDVAALEKYARTLNRGIRKFGTIVTVDQHKKEFYWHVSVSLLNFDGKPLPIEHLSSIERVVTLRLARELLDDVGRLENEDIHEDEKSIQIVRHVTIEEEREARKAVARTTASGPARRSKRFR